MESQKILLYYKFTPIVDPESVRLWQKTLCQSLNLRGRIIISKHGINGTVGGKLDDIKRYVKATKEYPAFKKNMDFKYSPGSIEDFPKLQVKVRAEIVTFGAENEILVDEKGVVGAGKHLSPQQVNDLVAKHGDEVIFFDGRNAFEAEIGRFKNAIIPNVRYTRNFVAEIESGKYDDIKKRPVVTYCTGGVRCEVLSSIMKKRGFENVYQLKGGIVRYGEQFGDNNLWEGSLYVFDKRMYVDFTENTQALGSCTNCGEATKKFANCADDSCHSLKLFCHKCEKSAQTRLCSKICVAS